MGNAEYMGSTTPSTTATMGIDLDAHHVRSTHRKAPKSDNVYLKLLVKLYRFLARKSMTPFHLLLTTFQLNLLYRPHRVFIQQGCAPPPFYVPHQQTSSFDLPNRREHLREVEQQDRRRYWHCHR